MAEAGIETGYAERFAQTTARQAAEDAAMSEWRVGGGSQRRGQFAEGLAGIRGNWASRRIGVEQYGAQLRGGWAERNIGSAERDVGVGLMVGGALLGGFGF